MCYLLWARVSETKGGKLSFVGPTIEGGLMDAVSQHSVTYPMITFGTFIVCYKI